ncbi:MAG TPA: hypothetical protein PLG90_06960 [Ignavibacteria bacterium]|nr:hypothetical protein [Ignavibacteria bacterium]
MRKLLFILLTIFLTPLYSFSQSILKNNFTFSHPLKFGSENTIPTKKNFSGNDSLKVVAILVQFQEDNSGLTSGNGRFDLSNKYFNPSLGRDTVIDAPPYDSAYFSDHLKFLKNYFEKSSNERLNVSYDLYGQVITLPKKMEDYSPRDGEQFNKLGSMFTDAWARADSFINFSTYNPNNTVFFLFHAGVGRDVELKSILGFDPTPFDIPSVYLGLKNLKDFYGQDYNGYQTLDGFFIQNTAILPSTELRELDLISGNILLELGINGLMCASVGSYLGLPDLFNTSTGKTAIGRFGLMDGQSIFSFNGIFPPEPSAWEKYFLGWVDPIVISSGEINAVIKTSSTGTFNDSTMYKVMINSSEYYLIENRNRDALNIGQTVYTRNRNFNDSNKYLKDEEGFNYFDISKISGNVTDVTTFDWSLPGLINDTANFKGGILIWHIDETIINSKFSSNTINNDINKKGIDLEEAKGAQTIGVTFSTPFGDITGDGDLNDYWYNGNHFVPATIYKNQFTPVSIPSSMSNSMANTNIYITDFDSIRAVMTFKIRIGGNIRPISGFPKPVGFDSNAQSVNFNFTSPNLNNEDIFVNNGNGLFGFNSSGVGISNPLNGLMSITGGKYIPFGFSNNNLRYIGGIDNNSILFIDNNLVNTTNNWSDGISTSPPMGFNNGILVGKNSGVISTYNYDGTSARIDSTGFAVRQFTRESTQTFKFTGGTGKYILSGNLTAPNSTDLLVIDTLNNIFVNGNRLRINYTVGKISTSPVLADINQDGLQEIIFNGDGKIFAMNYAGVLIDNYPVELTTKISSGISVADVNSDNIFDLIFITDDGKLYVRGNDGVVINGFPIQVGINTIATPSIANFNDSLGICVLSGDGYLYAFKTSYLYNGSKILWKNYLNNNLHLNNNFISTGSVPVISDKLPKDKVYNWPNPVYDNKTYIRYFLNGTTNEVIIKILDLSGEMVIELRGTTNSKTENEIVWDVTDVQSGVYYGVIEADIDGTKESRIIKIAVVK